jgi:dihydroorotate dehydrogenase (NAD+) catalytic subunit
MAEKLSDTQIGIIEVNVSCPNVKEGGMQFGVCASNVFDVTKEVKARSSVPVIVKLSPNVTSIAEIAKAAEDGGADAISLINTVLGMRIDINARKPILGNNIGGLSGPAILPIAIRSVWQAASAVGIPIFGMGGVSKGEDAVEMMLAGASIVGIGTANFTDPHTPLKIIDWLENYCKSHNIAISEIVGKVVLN